MKKRIFSGLFLFLYFSLQEVAAQCAMCKASVESSDNAGLTSGINGGILYMAVIPYLLLSVLGFIWYKNYKKFKSSGKKNKISGYRPKQVS